MLKPSLYYALFSPPARACMITAKLIDLNLQLKLVDFYKNEHMSNEFIKLNPQHQVPVFVDNDGQTYADSHAIMSFIVSKYAKDDKLYPKDISLRARVDHRMHFENGVLFQVIRDVMARNFYGGEVKFHRKTLAMCYNTYGFLEGFLKDRPYVVGENMTIADISINTSLITADLLMPVYKEKYPRLHAWMDRMRCLPDYEEVNVKGAQDLQGLIMTAMAENREKTK